MALVINTNVASLEAQNALSKAQELLTRSFQRLSSGIHINSAADDAAGLGISEDSLNTVVHLSNRTVRGAGQTESARQVASGVYTSAGMMQSQATAPRDSGEQSSGSINELVIKHRAIESYRQEIVQEPSISVRR